MLKPLVALTTLTALLATPPLALADGDQHPAIKYRQASMALIVANVKPMGDMLKNKIPWNEAQFRQYASDLAAVASINQLRGYPDEMVMGKTAAKEAIWDNFDDFSQKMEQFQQGAAELAQVSGSGDRKLIGEAFATVGKSCKSCHDDYKEK
ncbi:cytochrome c [Ectothiorhodospiraceae bacterium BW-2]|nr:cytochrome c [Ectothiorhodospiraceae bacterium BW-2]